MVVKKKEATAPEAEVKKEAEAPTAAVAGPKWVKVTSEQLAQIQKDGKLVGYDPAKGEALVK